MPGAQPPQTGPTTWGEAPQTSPHQRRAEAAYEQTGAMPAHPATGQGQPRGPQPQSGPQQSGPQQRPDPQQQPSPQQPGFQQPSGPQSRRRSVEETMVGGEAPRRARGRRGPGGPAGPGGPDGPGGPGREGPEEGRSGWKRFVPSWKIVVASGTILLIGIFGMVAVAYANTPIPDVTQSEAQAQGSVIYYSDGKTKIAELGTKRRIVAYEAIPKHVQDAVITAEDRSFWENAGIDFRGLGRSVWMTASGQQVQGASTITQQMSRNYYEGLSKDVSISRKVKEIFVSVKLSKEKDKKWILTNYLNTIYFGRGAYGIEAAAQAYFGAKTQAKDLTVPQAAYLAGRIQNPGNFDKAEAAKNFAPTKERYNYVIKAMAEADPEYAKYASVPFEKLKFASTKSRDKYKGLPGYMLNIVERELAERSISEEDLNTGGYKVVTTFNKDLMLAARKAVNGRTSQYPSTVHTSLAAVNPKNGRVVAFYSGDDYLADFNNRAFDAAKQAASAFKPYVLAAWLERGWSLNSYIEGMKTYEAPGTKPISNAGMARYGSINLVKATASSVNTVFVQMGEKAGLDEVARIAKGAGVGVRAERALGKNSVDWAIDQHSFAMTIGSATVTAVEQAAGYSIFANGGKHVDWHTVISVKDFNGLEVVPEKRMERTVISEEAAADATFAMQAVIKGGTGGAANIGRPAAGKTGTNNDSKDAWFVGYTPQLSTSVSMYKEVPYTKDGKRPLKLDKDGKPVILQKDPKYPVLTKEEPLPGEIGGGGKPTEIWHDFMAAAMANRDVEQFPAKADGGAPENLAPKPTPTPTPSTDPFENENPFQNPECSPLLEDCTPGDDIDTGQETPIDPGTTDPGDLDDELSEGLNGGGAISSPAPVAGRPTDE